MRLPAFYSIKCLKTVFIRANEWHFIQVIYMPENYKLKYNNYIN